VLTPAGQTEIHALRHRKEAHGLLTGRIALALAGRAISLGMRLSGLLSVLAFTCLSALILSRPCLAETEPPFELPPRKELLKIRSAIIDTPKGRLYFELFPEEAPWHVANFKYLADKKFYDNLSFHLFEPGYLIQGGDPRGDGFGGPGYSLPGEFSPRNHRFGTLGMARKPDGYDSKKRLVNPQRVSSGSQFHILLTEAPHMDGRYTIFGKLVGGRAILERLGKGDTIKSVTVFIREGGR
jgi:peptidyl-prolyl cis-trans isomerase B (cyclophilin B)